MLTIAEAGNVFEGSIGYHTRIDAIFDRMTTTEYQESNCILVPFPQVVSLRTKNENTIGRCAKSDYNLKTLCERSRRFSPTLVVNLMFFWWSCDSSIRFLLQMFHLGSAPANKFQSEDEAQVCWVGKLDVRR